MKHEYKRYVMGLLMVMFQYVIFRVYGFFSNMSVEMENISFLIYIFLFLKEDIYSFKTCLIWEELRRETKCYLEFMVIIGVISHYIYGIENIGIYMGLGTIVYFYSILLGITIRMIFHNYMKTNVVIVGVGDTAKRVSDIMSYNLYPMYNLLGFIDINKEENKKIESERILGNREELVKLADKEMIHEVLVAIPELSDLDINMFLENIYSKVKKIKMIPKINNSFTVSLETEDYENMLMLTNKNLNSSLKRAIVKRIEDVIFGVLGCLLLIPLSVVIYFKTDKKERAKGIFFTQDRIGKDGKKIKIYKYRSMVTGADAILKKLLSENEELKEEYRKNKKLKNDPRITKIGEFLRKTSLDEFPQFINVLRGEMSFVGPRPYLFDEIEDMGKSYEKIIERKPGITGMWQTHGRSDTDFEERLLLDEYYYRNWSLWLDIVIIIKTVLNVVKKKGAY